jgi:hypothetical protein
LEVVLLIKPCILTVVLNSEIAIEIKAEVYPLFEVGGD